MHISHIQSAWGPAVGAAAPAEGRVATSAPLCTHPRSQLIHPLHVTCLNDWKCRLHVSAKRATWFSGVREGKLVDCITQKSFTLLSSAQRLKWVGFKGLALCKPTLKKKQKNTMTLDMGSVSWIVDVLNKAADAVICWIHLLTVIQFSFKECCLLCRQAW